jgi:hypothetical protein
VAGFTGDDLIEEALRYAGGEQSTSDDVISARRSMYLLMEEWAARYGQSFRVGRIYVDLLPGTPGFPLQVIEDVLPDGGGDPIPTVVQEIDEVIDITVATKPDALATDTFVPVGSRLSASEYAKITDKLTDGQPSSYYLERSEPPLVYLHPTGAGRSATVWFHRKPAPYNQDANTVDLPRRWHRALMLGTALHVAAKRPWPTDPAMMNSQQQRINQLEGWATAAFAEARPSDRERSPFRVRLT